jgi:hypothetical protein
MVEKYLLLSHAKCHLFQMLGVWTCAGQGHEAYMSKSEALCLNSCAVINHLFFFSFHFFMSNFGKHLRNKKRKFLQTRVLWFVWYERIRVERVCEAENNKRNKVFLLFGKQRKREEKHKNEWGPQLFHFSPCMRRKTKKLNNFFVLNCT